MSSAEYHRAYYEAHREAIRAHGRAYYEAHREAIRAQQWAYHEAHRAEINARRRAYYAAHREEYRARGQAYREAHHDEIRARQSAYYAAHREEICARQNAQRAAARAAAWIARMLDAPVSAEELGELDRIRPECRRDCEHGLRPCPYFGCRYHLGLEVDPRGVIWLRGGGLDDTRDTCALDVAERGRQTLHACGVALGVTRERARQNVASGLSHFRAMCDSPELFDFSE